MLKLAFRLYQLFLKMEKDDIIYISLLILTIVFGQFFRQLVGSDIKKWVSTILGVIMVIFVSGAHALHPLICTLVNAFIILYTSKRSCHTLSFGFTFLYLFFFRTTIYFGIPYAPSHTNLIQMMLTLKVVGLAFEVHDSYMVAVQRKKAEPAIEGEQEDKVHPGFWDIIHYVFCYIGVLTGPFYSYRTFDDYIKTGFDKYAPCGPATVKKLMFVPLYAAVYLLTTHYYPIKYAESDEFYSDTSFLYRLWYMTPVFVTFRMRIYIGLILSECACTMAGLGAYPASTQPRPGKGPSTNLQLIQQLANNEELKSKEVYDFETVHNIDPWYTEFDPSVRSTIRYWNMCIQYWMAYVVYKRFPSKALRTGATFAVSAIWHGIYAGYFLCLCVVPFYLPIEDIWEKLMRRDAKGTTRVILNVLFWIVRTQAFTYMGMAFSLLSMEKGLRYYGSIYYVYHVTSVIALGLGLALKKFTKKKSVVPEETKKLE